MNKNLKLIAVFAVLAMAVGCSKGQKPAAPKPSGSSSSVKDSAAKVVNSDSTIQAVMKDGQDTKLATSFEKIMDAKEAGQTLAFRLQIRKQDDKKLLQPTADVASVEVSIEGKNADGKDIAVDEINKALKEKQATFQVASVKDNAEVIESKPLNGAFDISNITLVEAGAYVVKASLLDKDGKEIAATAIMSLDVQAPAVK